MRSGIMAAFITPCNKMSIRKIAVCKLMQSETISEVISGEKKPDEVKNFDYDEQDINYADDKLSSIAQDWAENCTSERDIEVFEIKGNYIFTDSGIFAALYMDNLEEVTDELT